MRDLITDAMVETAAQAMWERIDREESWSEIYHASAYRRDARAALEAAAPLIAADALRDAADAIDSNSGEISMPVGLIAVALRAHADRIEKEDA